MKKEIKDLRIYNYIAGNLKKSIDVYKTSKFNNIDSVYDYIKNLDYKRKKHYNQFIIIEYFENYKSKIIDIIDN